MQGSLARDHLPLIIRSLHGNGESGILHISRNARSKRIFFGQGSMVFAGSDYRDDRLGEFLLRKGKMTLSHFEIASKKVKETGLKLGAVMVAMGIMTEREVQARVNEQVRAIIYSLFRWDKGEYCFESNPDPIASEMAMNLPTIPIILEGTRQAQNPSVIRRALGNMDRVVSFAKDPLAVVDEIRLTPSESFVLSRVDGQSSIANILSICPIEENETLQCLYGLISAGFLELGGKSRELIPSRDTFSFTGPTEEFAKKPKAKAGGGGEISAEEKWIRDDIINKHNSLSSGTYYDWLEIRRTAIDDEIKKAYSSMIKKYHPDRLHSRGLDDVRKSLEEIVDKVTSAYRALSEPLARRRYDNSLRTEAPKGEGLSSRVLSSLGSGGQSTTSSKNDAERYYQEAVGHLEQGKTHLAIQVLKESLRLEPSRASTHRLLAEAFATNPKWRKNAEEHYRKAVKIDPFDVESLVGLAEIYEMVGMRSRAAKMFSRALGIDPMNETLKTKLASFEQSDGWKDLMKMLQ